MSVVDNKSDLRKKHKHIRREIPPYLKLSADRSIFQKLINLNDFINSENVFTYISTEIEVDTRNLIEYCFKNSKRVYVPRCEEGHKMDFYEISSLEGLEISKYGIPEPSPLKHKRFSGEYKGVCIVPALSFDKSLSRLGYGGGYYDRFLSENGGLIKIGLCYECCIAEKIPAEEFDVSADIVVTENNIFGGKNG